MQEVPKTRILDGVKKVVVYDTQNDTELAVITADSVITASDNIVVKLSFED